MRFSDLECSSLHLEIFDEIHDKLTLGQFPQKSHLRGRGVLLI